MFENLPIFSIVSKYENPSNGYSDCKHTSRATGNKIIGNKYQPILFIFSAWFDQSLSSSRSAAMTCWGSVWSWALGQTACLQRPRKARSLSAARRWLRNLESSAELSSLDFASTSPARRSTVGWLEVAGLGSRRHASLAKCRPGGSGSLSSSQSVCQSLLGSLKVKTVLARC